MDEWDFTVALIPAGCMRHPWVVSGWRGGQIYLFAIFSGQAGIAVSSPRRNSEILK
jgi:hypothetical protein